MTDRILKLISLVPKSKIFADIGCDHGYVAKGVLEEGKAERVIISDISKNCLIKAEKLLYSYIQSGIVKSVVSNGFQNISEVDTALIAGMGGEEIIKIVSERELLPKNLILQPMKNCDKVREYVVHRGYKIISDEVFCFDKKFYDFIVLEIGQDTLSQDEIIFGRTNLISLHKDFIDRLNCQKKLIVSLLKKDLSSDERIEKEKLLERIEKYV